MDRIGTYAVERKLGEGGMGTVYLARSRGGRAVAVKVAKPELASDPAFRERFHAEIEAARKVGGFHTAPVVDADPDAEPPWLATAYVPGPTLSQLLAAEGPMDEAALRRLGASLAEALQAIHACGLVHRDLKPGNIVMAEDGPRVLDFGIARAVGSTRPNAAGAAYGTPGFLAPEQARGHAVTSAADVFALGAVLVSAAGGSAFGEGSPSALLYRSAHHGADVSAVPEGLRPVVAACLAKDPEDRPGTGLLLDWFTEEPDAAELPAALTLSAVPAVAAVPAPLSAVSAAPTVPTALAVPPQPAGRPGAYPSVTDLPTQATPPPPQAEFLATDRRSDIVADADGVSFSVKGLGVDFSWHEIRTARYVRDDRGGLTVTVTLDDANTYSCRVTTPHGAELDTWTARLDTVLALFHRP
ncbi:serine/threonine protein kinase [Streptomyces carminius]|uniref:Serine/threonine protein kinase n=2 Tax=Streptomyces carminius TaxID=2665496 RepID=A0A2M8LZP9_9ACTN|nr:serine/threonine-protein kinase [Streptomyces carminius]PJE97428.1 serine/threonine protein kinase [Streptomyces carminius]